MHTNLKRRWSNALMLSIALLLLALMGLAVRAFASAAISSSIFFAAIGVVFVTVLLYLGIRRLRARGAIDRIVLWIPRPDWPRRNRCRKAAARVKERNAVSNERQDKQEAGLSTPKCVSSLQQD
jgi:threonine/homoserine/homoserine lactone efflux protein